MLGGFARVGAGGGNAVFPDARFALSVCVLPLGEDLQVVFVVFANGGTIVVCDEESALVRFEQSRHFGVVKVFMMNRKVAIRVHPLEHGGVFSEVIWWVQEEEIIGVVVDDIFEICAGYAEVAQCGCLQFLNSSVKLVLVDFIGAGPSEEHRAVRQSHIIVVIDCLHEFVVL